MNADELREKIKDIPGNVPVFLEIHTIEIFEGQADADLKEVKHVRHSRDKQLLILKGESI